MNAPKSFSVDLSTYAFEFAGATQVVFGPGTLQEAGNLSRPWGQRALLVTGKNPKRADRLRGYLESAGITVEVFPVVTEPTVATVSAGLEAARAGAAEFVIGFGGGSALDTAKAIAGLLTNPGDLLDYLEVVGRGQPLLYPAAPWLAIPTTSGTGSEVTRNAVLSVPEKQVKASLRSSHLLARIALVDPELTLDLPPAVTASTGLDALTQLLEAYVCTRANPLTDALCAAGLPRAAQALPLVWKEPHQLSARTDLALASLWSGFALANAGLGAVHGFAAPLGGLLNAPHGALCAALLAPVMAANLRALRERAPHDRALSRYDEIACWLTGRATATADEGIDWVRARVSTFRIQPLSRYGFTRTHRAELVAKAQQASSMKANPIALTAEELSAILDEAT